MANEIMVTIVLRHNTTAGWEKNKNIILNKGELGIEFIANDKSPKLKIGNGRYSWDKLPYFDINLPEKYTWGELRGTTLENEATYTENLNLKKPGYGEVASIKVLNDNYDLIDLSYKDLYKLIDQLTSRMDSVVKGIKPGVSGTFELELQDMRVRYDGSTYGSAGSAMRAIDEDLQNLSDNLSQFIGSSVPDGLSYSNNYLQLTSNGEPIGDAVEIIGGSGGGGGTSSYVITLTNLLDSRIISVSAGTPVELRFKYVSIDNEGYTDGNGVGSLSINNTKQTSFAVLQGENAITITDYLKTGTNNVKIQVTNSEGAYRTLSYTVNILVLSITTTSPMMGAYNVDSLNIQYTVTGSGSKTVYFILDGKEYKSEIITSTGQSRQLSLPRQPDGAHILEIYATSESEGGLIGSNILRIGIIWYSDTTSEPIVLINNAITSVTQGESLTIPYMIFHPHYETIQITREILNEDSSVYKTDKLIVDRNQKEWTTQDFPSGSVTFKITCENVFAHTTINVLPSSFNKEIYTDNLLFDFNAKGRSNFEDNPASWSSGDVVASFSNIGWRTIDGWLTDTSGQDMLRLLPKSEVFIPYFPFKEEVSNTGYTIEVELATQNVSDYDSVIVSSYSGDRGLLIKSQSASLKSEQTETTIQFKEDDRVRLDFIIEQNSSGSNRLMYTYVNGVCCGIQQYASNDQFRQSSPVGITIGADSCGIDIYLIRFYNITFTAEMQLNNFIVDRPSLADRIEKDNKNNITDKDATDVHKKVTINSLKDSIPYIVMQCPELPQYKGDKKKNMSLYYVDPLHPEKNFSAAGVQFDVQGTSSATYPVKNFKTKCKSGIVYEQSGQEAEGFQFTEDSLTSETFCLKADYASSEHANNVCLVDFYNSNCPYKTPPQQVDERVRQGVYGQPIVLFWENTDTKEISYEGMYNMNDDKSNENIFGFVDIDISSIIPVENQRIECWEWLNNNSKICLFQGDEEFDEFNTDSSGELYPAWQDSLEPRYPDLDEMYSETDALRKVIKWVASTDTTRATNATLSEPKYYTTRDTSWNNAKTYYKDNKGTPATIIEKGAITSYNPSVSVDRDAFYTKMAATSYAELVGGYEFIKNDDATWSAYKDSTLISSAITSIGDYGITLGDASIESFAFEYKLVGEGWNASLYEYYTMDSAEYRLSKFKEEFEEYFILEAMTFYYIFTEVFLMTDSRAKNMFLTTFDGVHWFPLPYDMDTAIGINNEGRLVFDYNLEDTDLVDGSMVFNAQQSVLWINFRLSFYTRIKQMYNDLRSTGKFSFQEISKKMDAHQDAWAEILWNIDGEIKYLLPFYSGSNNLAMAQGDKRTQRNFWLFNAFKYRDSKYEAGEAVTNYIHLRLYNKGEIRITPYSHIYARVEFGNAKDELKRAYRNEEVVFNTDGIAAVNDLETHIYSSDRISSLGDLSPLKIGYCDFSMAPKLKNIIVGSEDPSYSNGNLNTFTLGVSDLLQEINISNCYNLATNIDASKCYCLEIFKAFGTKITGVNFSDGGRLRVVRLPETISSLILKNQTQIEELSIKSYENISTLWIENSPNIPLEEIASSSNKLDRVRLVNVDWTTESEETLRAFYDKVITCSGLDSSGLTIESPIVTGKVRINSISDSFLELLNEKFPELICVVNGVEKYFIKYVDNNNNEVYKYIASGGTDAIDPVAEGLILQEDISIPEDTEDTKYHYDGWVNLPTNIDRSYIIRVNYNYEFRVQFLDANGEPYVPATQWIYKGNSATDPYLSGLIEKPTKEPTAEKSFEYSKWDKSFNKVEEPLNINPIFIETINTYTVQFWTIGYTVNDELVPLKTQTVSYGGTVSYNEDIDGKVYYYINGEISPYYSFYGWDSPLTITPTAYTEDPIIIKAQFTFTGYIEDSWEQIDANAQAGNIDAYGLGGVKISNVTIDGTTYQLEMELVEKNFDLLVTNSSSYNGGTGKACFTFLAKNIIDITKQINTSTSKEYEGYTSSTAGGYGNSDMRSWLNSTFYNGLDADFRQVIKPVYKIADKGNIPDSGLITTEEKVWLPSATELNLDNLGAYGGLFYLDQSANGENYSWFSNDDTRIKYDKDKVAREYWTRTYSIINPNRFITIKQNGSLYANNESGKTVWSYCSFVIGACV